MDFVVRINVEYQREGLRQIASESETVFKKKLYQSCDINNTFFYIGSATYDNMSCNITRWEGFHFLLLACLARISHEFFDLKLNYLTLHLNDDFLELQGVFRFKSKSSPFGSIDFSAKSPLQTTCGSLLQQRGLCLDLRKTLLMRNSG
jgi:hypothetical protein